MRVRCEVCERELEIQAAVLWDDHGEVHYFCSEECFEQVGENLPVDAGYVDDEAV
ncbi:MAG: hypothetical protein QNJ90_06330 [Planctomycetota bacterium]|nr:hypothetical protein [Planctomycetota bacterium]